MNRYYYVSFVVDCGFNGCWLEYNGNPDVCYFIACISGMIRKEYSDIVIVNVIEVSKEQYDTNRKIMEKRGGNK